MEEKQKVCSNCGGMLQVPAWKYCDKQECDKGVRYERNKKSYLKKRAKNEPAPPIKGSAGLKFHI